MLGGRGRGDQYVAVGVVTPTSLSREQKKLFEELSQMEASHTEDRSVMDKVKDIFG